MPWQIRRRILVVAFMVVLGVSGRAVTNWVSADALGDVAVSFDGAVQVFDNASGLVVDTIDTTSVSQLTGTNGGLAFDAPLNLVVANTAGNQLVKLSPTHPHGSVGTIGTQASPASLAFAADGSVYVASPGSPATIRRFSKTGTQLRSFTVATDSSDCIGIDLSPDQKTLLVASGGRKIRAVSDVSLTSPPNPPALTVSIFADLQGSGGTGTACGLRILAPIDIRSLDPAPPPGTILPAVGGIIRADKGEIKRLDRFGAVVEEFNTGANSEKHNWVDVALDPNTQDFFGVDAGEVTRLVKFRIGGANQLVVSPLTGVPRGVAVNGELRAAQSTRVLNLTANVEGAATFLEPPFQHSWKGIAPVNVSIAIQAIEVIYDPNGATPASCPASLDVRCRLQKFIDQGANPIPKAYSRGRSVVYREILLSALSDPRLWTISFVFPANNTDRNHAGVPCGAPGSPEGSSGVLRDPYPHDFFSIDPSLGFYGGDDVIPIKSRGNDSIVVDRGDGQFNMLIIKPVAGTVGNLGSSLPIAVEATTPPGCTDAPGLESKLVLSVVDITVVNGIPLDTVVGDSKGILGGAPLIGNGGIFAKVANQYRTNLDLTKGRFQKNHAYRLCISALAAETVDGQFVPPPAGEVCQDITTK